MPLIQLDTSCSLSDQNKKQSLAKTLSRLAAEGTRKPEQYVMACVRDNVAITMSGAPSPCALVTIKAIGGLNKSVNQTIADQVSQVLQKELAISSNCVYITFEELAPTHWAWNGKTFG
jgi:phenylpyruvate tautomerase PptA (4-oxalocrotonate tautomerase family)